jgi:MFS family permease
MSLRSPLFWLVMAHTFLLQLLTMLVRPTISYRAIELGVDTEWLGAIAAAFAMLPLIGAIWIGRAIDKGKEWAVLVSGAVLVLLSLVGLWLFGDSVAALLAFSMLLGLGHLASMVAQQVAVARAAAPGEHGFAFARYGVAAAAGQAFGPILVTLLGGEGAIPHTGVLFATGTGVSLLFVVAALLMRTGQPKKRDPDERARLRDVLHVPGLGAAVLAGLMVVTAMDLVVVYLPALGAEQGIDARVIGLLLTARAVAAIASRLLMRPMLKALGWRRLLVASMASAALFIATLAFDLPLWATTTAMIVTGMGLGVGMPLTLAWVTTTAPTQIRATALSLRLTGNRLGQTVIPLAVGVLASSVGTAGVFWATSGGLLGAAVTAARAPGGGLQQS